ncbi:MAG: hypothetical protein FWC55_03320, partial [Firmicutes bacterium]|nr:hypothetical protein [Bacillota bacterium]
MARRGQAPALQRLVSYTGVRKHLPTTSRHDERFSGVSATEEVIVVSFEIELQTSRKTPLNNSRFALVFSSFQIET